MKNGLINKIILYNLKDYRLVFKNIVIILMISFHLIMH